MKIHKEGYLTIFIITSILTIFNVILFLFLNSPGSISIRISIFVSVVILLFVSAFFRKPNRMANRKSDSVLSPADGKIVVVEKVRNSDFFNDERIQVSVFMSVWNVHQNWIPVNGKICLKKYNPGLFLLAKNPKSSTDNESATTIIEYDKGKKILVKQIAGVVARRIITSVKEDDFMEQGEELGFIKFGSRVDILLPLNAKVKVKPGDKVRGIKTVIAEL